MTYYLYGNTFYKRVVTNGQESFVVVMKPAGVVAVKALPEDFEPMQAGSMVYFRSKGRYYLTYLDPSGEELVPRGRRAGGGRARGPGRARRPRRRPLRLPAPRGRPPPPSPRPSRSRRRRARPLTVRVATEVNSGTAQAGQRFQGNLDADLVADDGASWPRGAPGSTAGSSRQGGDGHGRGAAAQPWS